MNDGTHETGDQHGVLAQQLQAFRRRLAAAGVTVAIGADVPLTEQLAQLQDAALAALERCGDTEQVLRRSEERLREVLESTTDGFLAIDRDWRYTYVNERGAHMVGSEPEDLVGGRVWDLYPAAMESKFGTEYFRVMETGEPAHFEEFYPDPLNLWLETHVYRTDEGLAVYFRDITQRKRDEEALRERTALLQAISDATGDVIYAKDREGRLRYANPATLALIGKPLENVLGKTDLEFLEDKAAARQVMENDQRVMSTGTAQDLEEMVPLPDGTQRIWFSRKAPYRDAQGQVVGLLGISRDITERKRAADALRESEQRYRSFVRRQPRWCGRPMRVAKWSWISRHGRPSPGRAPRKRRALGG